MYLRNAVSGSRWRCSRSCSTEIHEAGFACFTRRSERSSVFGHFPGQPPQAVGTGIDDRPPASDLTGQRTAPQPPQRRVGTARGRAGDDELGTRVLVQGGRQGEVSRRHHGTGRIYVKWGSYYGRWAVDGRKVNRKLGRARQPGSRDGLTKREAEAVLRRMMSEVAAPADERLTMAEAGEHLIEKMEIKGRKPTTIEAASSTLRVHLMPHFREQRTDRIDTRAVDRFIAAERRAGAAPKSIRNYLGILHSIYELAIERGWARENPVKRATKPQDSATTEIRFLTIEELEAVLVAVPEDVLGSIERTLYLTAAMTGLRQGELLGLRWGDVDWLAGRIRVRRAYVRGEYGTPKSRRGSRAVPLADRVAVELEALSQRTLFAAETISFSRIPGPADRSTAPSSASGSRRR